MTCHLLTPKAFKLNNKASVPLPTATTYFDFKVLKFYFQTSYFGT